MKNSLLRKTICIFTALLLLALPLSCVGAAASSSPYPSGVSVAEALGAVAPTDRLISSVSYTFNKKSLPDATLPLLYSSDTLSSIMTGFYTSLASKQAGLKVVGIDISPAAIGRAMLGVYPKVCLALFNANSWSEVNMKGVSWGVSTKQQFAEAIGYIFSPFNNLLYCLLCSGTYTSGLISVSGSNGYENAVVPMLQSLDCKGMISQSDFTNAAIIDKNSMAVNIVMPVLALAEQALAAPADTLTVSLPGFAYFSQSGQFSSCMDSLLSPITGNNIVKAAISSGILDASVFKFDAQSLLNNAVSRVAAAQGIKIRNINLSVLAACGTKNGDSFTTDQSKAYVAIMRYLIEELKLNEAKFSHLVGPSASVFVHSALAKDTDVILTAVIRLFESAAVAGGVNLQYPEVAKAAVAYTDYLGADDFVNVLNNIDGVLDEFVEEFTSYSSLQNMLHAQIYSGSSLGTIVVQFYTYLEKQGLTDLFSAIGSDITPRGVASLLTENRYASVRAVLNKTAKWSSLSEKSLTNWGIKDGVKDYFIYSLAAALRPLFPILRTLLAGQSTTVLNSIPVTGGNGYENGVIPILEALGCSSDTIKTYAEYLKDASGDGVVTDILEPFFTLADRAFEKPVATACEILPNIVYFKNSGSLTACVESMLAPLTAIQNKLSSVYTMNLSVSKVINDIDVGKMLTGALKKQGIAAEDPNLSVYGSIGTLQSRQSKRMSNNQFVQYGYMVSDQTAVLITMLRYAVTTIKLPANKKLIDKSLKTADTGMFADYVDKVAGKLQNMSVDEVIEWLYGLFFRPKATKTVADASYSPTILYKPRKKWVVPLIVTCSVLLISAAAAAIWYEKRKKQQPILA